jgi:hypothetical protein
VQQGRKAKVEGKISQIHGFEDLKACLETYQSTEPEYNKDTQVSEVC